jgi:hypothetical protein
VTGRRLPRGSLHRDGGILRHLLGSGLYRRCVAAHAIADVFPSRGMSGDGVLQCANTGRPDSSRICSGTLLRGSPGLRRGSLALRRGLLNNAKCWRRTSHPRDKMQTADQRRPLHGLPPHWRP